MKQLTWCALLGCVGLLFGQSVRQASPEPKFSELTREDSERLDRQRAIVAAALKQRYGTEALTRTRKDLPILQRLLDDKAFEKSQTYELQSLGVAFDDGYYGRLARRSQTLRNGSAKMTMTILFKVEDIFYISGRGCVIVPAIPQGLDFRIRAKNQIELRNPDGRILQTHIASIELAKPQLGSPCRMVIMLPPDIAKHDVPIGTESGCCSLGQMLAANCFFIG